MKILFIQTNYPNFLKQFYSKIDCSNLSYKQIKEIWAKQYFGASNFYLKGLKNLGWQGDEVIVNDEISQSRWAKENKVNVRIKDPKYLRLIPERLKNLLGLNNGYKKIIFKQIDKMKPDVVYIHDVTYFSTEELKNIKSKARLIVGQIAYPKPLNPSIFKSYDLIISSLHNYIEDFKKMGVIAEYLPWCFEETILKDIKTSKRTYNTTYIGGFSPHHSQGNKILEYVSKKVKIDFWGYGENYLPINSNIKNSFHGEAWGKDMYQIFAKSKIVVNRHINISKQYANNMRMFEATGMGALLITDTKVNNNEFFDIGKEIVVYSTPEDLVKKIKYYLKNESLRKKIAKAGQRRTLREHTYKLKMRELDKILLKYL